MLLTLIQPAMITKKFLTEAQNKEHDMFTVYMFVNVAITNQRSKFVSDNEK